MYPWKNTGTKILDLTNNAVIFSYRSDLTHDTLLSYIFLDFYDQFVGYLGVDGSI